MAFYSNPAYTNPSYPAAPITGDSLANIDPQAVRMLWQEGFDVFEYADDFFQTFEGPSPDNLIHTITDLSAGKGSQITFTIGSELGYEPHFGDQVFSDSSHYEQLLIGANTLWVDWVRHAVRFTQRTEELMGMRGEVTSFIDELQQGVPRKLGGWAGRLKTEQLLMMWREIMPGDNTIVLTGPLSWQTLLSSTFQMKRNGALPAIMGKDPKGQPVKKYMIIPDEDAINSLENDEQFIAYIRDTKDPQGCQYVFTGGWPDIRGHAIRPLTGIFHDGYFAQGSVLKPMGRLGQAIALTSASYSTPLYIYGGGTDLDLSQSYVKPMKWFPNYAFTWGPGTLNPNGSQLASLPAGNKAFCVAIVNPANAATDPGKWGLYLCTSNDGVKLTVQAALVDNNTVTSHAGTGGGPNLTNAFSSTDGSVSGDNIGTGALAAVTQSIVVSGVNVKSISNKAGYTWVSGANSYTHPVGASIYLVGPDAIPVFNTLILSANCCRRGYGKYRGTRVPDTKEGGFIQERYFMSVFGQNIRTNRLGYYPGAIKLFHQGTIQGTPLPGA